jgi:hypothetical protein
MVKAVNHPESEADGTNKTFRHKVPAIRFSKKCIEILMETRALWSKLLEIKIHHLV